MGDAAADYRFGAAAKLSTYQVTAERDIRRDFLSHHPLGLPRGIRPALRQTADAHRDHHIGFGGERPSIHAYVEPVGKFWCRGHPQP